MSILTPYEFFLGKIPTISDLNQTPNFLKDIYLEHKEQITSMLIYGSIPRGDFTIASDIDCLLIHNSIDAQQSISKKLRKYHNNTYVDIQVKWIYLKNLELGICPIDNPAFAQHLIKNTQQGVLLGENPFQKSLIKIDQSSQTIKEDAKKSFEYRINRIINKKAYFTPKERSSLLTQIIQEPWHLARQFIQWHEPDYFANPEIIDSKNTIENKLEELLVSLKVSRDNNNNFLSTSKNLKANYLKKLEIRKSIEEAPSKELLDEYSKTLNLIENEFENYLNFYYFLFSNLS